MDEPWASPSQLRKAFLKAGSGERWQTLITKTLAAVREGESGLLSDPILRIECAGIAAHYAYLLRWIAPAHALISAAERCVEEVRDSDEHDRAYLACWTGKHRLLRNLRARGDGDTGSFTNAKQTLINAVENLSAAPGRVTATDLFHARLEMAHAARNEGQWQHALPLYEALARDAANDEVFRWLVYHYAVSLVCDFVELLILPDEPLDRTVSSLQARAQLLGRRFSSEYQTKLKTLVRGLPQPEETQGYPFLDALFHKHRALWLAWTDRSNDAETEIEEASRLFARFRVDTSEGPTKGQLLCSDFHALVQVRRGDIEGAIGRLEEVVQGSRGYYPRLEQRGSTHLCYLRHLLSEPLRREEAEAARGAFNKLDRRKVLPLAVESGYAPRDELERLERESATRIEQVYLDRLPAWLSGLKSLLFGERMMALALAGAGPGIPVQVDAQVGSGLTGTRPAEWTVPQATPLGADAPETGQTPSRAGQEGSVEGGKGIGLSLDRLARLSWFLGLVSCGVLFALVALSVDETTRRLLMALTFFLWTSWANARWFALRRKMSDRLCGAGTPRLQ